MTQTPGYVSCDERNHRHPDWSQSTSVLFEVSGSIGQLSGGWPWTQKSCEGLKTKWPPLPAVLPLCSRFTEQKHLFVCPDQNSHSDFLDPNPDMLLYSVDLTAKAFPKHNCLLNRNRY